MIRWESIIGSKMRPAARTAEMVASERKKEYNRKREATPERKAAHRAAGRAYYERNREKILEKRKSDYYKKKEKAKTLEEEKEP